MNIWNILNIEPTIDKNLIKKAYAKRSKEVHPEERPEEFQILYEAYQRALEYAEKGKRFQKDTIEDWSEREPEGRIKETEVVWHSAETKEAEQKKEPDDADGLTEFFSQKLKYKSACLEKFNLAWERLCRRYGLPGEGEQWEAFLGSEEFKEIQMEPQVMEQIAEGLKGKLKYEDKYHTALWEAYHFTEEAEDQYHGEEWLLYDSLCPVIGKQKKEREKREAEYKRAEKKEKRRKGRNKAGVITVCAVFIFFLISGCLKVVSRKWAVTGYMNRKYAGTQFTKPQDQGVKGAYGERLYILHPTDQPMLDISVILQTEEGRESSYFLSDDYGEQLIQQYGEPYGLKVSTGVYTWYERNSSEIYIFYYEDMDDISRFCQSFYQMLRVQGEESLSFVKQVGFCAENICFPEMMLEEGRGSLWERPVFSINDLPQPEELERILRKSYVEYRHQYEAWNLTSALEAEYGKEYIAEGRKQEEKSENSGSLGPWAALEDLKKTEQEAGLFLPVYKQANYNQSQYTGTHTYYITSGNAYQYLKARVML